MPDSKTLDTIYTLAEAAERLRLKKHAVARLARRTGHCSVNGRYMLFSEADLLALWQEMRVKKNDFLPIGQATSGGQFFDTSGLEHLLRPAITVDKRVIGVLQWLSTQRQPKTSAQIPRCGPRTVEELLRQNLVKNCGKDGDGLIKIAILPPGRDQVRKYERWLERRKKARGGR